jgi:hypothetical protein
MRRQRRGLPDDDGVGLWRWSGTVPDWREPGLSPTTRDWSDRMADSTEKTLLGEVEQLVLLAVLRLNGEAYAVPIRELIRQDARVTLLRGSIYVTLERLERKRFLESWF